MLAVYPKPYPTSANKAKFCPKSRTHYGPFRAKTPDANPDLLGQTSVHFRARASRPHLPCPPHQTTSAPCPRAPGTPLHQKKPGSSTPILRYGLVFKGVHFSRFFTSPTAVAKPTKPNMDKTLDFCGPKSMSLFSLFLTFCTCMPCMVPEGLGTPPATGAPWGTLGSPQTHAKPRLWFFMFFSRVWRRAPNPPNPTWTKH